MSFPLTERMPIVRVVIRIGPVTLRHLENNYADNFEPWPNCVPKELEVRALIDTGASVSIIDSCIAERLQLRPSGFCSIRGFDSSEDEEGNAQRYLNYEVGLSILADSPSTDFILTIGAGQAVAHPLNPKFDAMLGMDVLKYCNFHLDGPNECFELSTPESFVEEMSSISLPCQ